MAPVHKQYQKLNFLQTKKNILTQFDFMATLAKKAMVREWYSSK